MAEYQQDFTFTPLHLGTLRFNDAEILTVEEAVDEETGEPMHGVFEFTLTNSITGTSATHDIDFNTD